MLHLLMGVFLFGMTHPLAKIFLNLNLSVQAFCLVFLFFRIIIQLPVVAYAKAFSIRNPEHFFTLLALGIVGAGLHLSEFASLNLGLSVPTVSFLIFTHPVWTQFFQVLLFKDYLSLPKLLRLSTAIFAIGLILIPEASALTNNILLLVPLLSSLCFSAWVILSASAQKRGITTIQMSFYYDLFSFIFVAAGTGLTHPLQAELFSISTLPLAVILSLLFYSLFVGLIGNYLFFSGVKQKGSLAASYALLLEPVISSLFGVALFGTHLTPLFLFGAVLILAVNLPESSFSSLYGTLFRLAGRTKHE